MVAVAAATKHKSWLIIQCSQQQVIGVEAEMKVEGKSTNASGQLSNSTTSRSSSRRSGGGGSNSRDWQITSGFGAATPRVEHSLGGKGLEGPIRSVERSWRILLAHLPASL